MSKKATLFFSCALLLLALLLIVVIRAAHPDVTETRLFLSYWWVWLIVFSLCLLAGILVGRR